MSRMLAAPEVPETQRIEAPVPLRYEDVSEDGRLALHSMPQAIGEVFWRYAMARGRAQAFLRDLGVVPILTRLVTEGGDGPLGVRAPLHGAGVFELAHSVDANAEVDKLLLNVWVKLTGEVAAVHGPAPSNAGEKIVAGQVHAEHVFTRPFAAPAERRVRRFSVPGMEPVPPVRREWRRARDVFTLPDGAKPLEPVSRDDAFVFGLDHTDSNRHVNSLIYPRLIREAALRRFATHGRSTRLLARFQDTAFRKPFFAGEKGNVVVRAFELGAKLGAICAVFPDGVLEPGQASWDSEAELAAIPAHAYGLVLFE
ncbi:MAG: hypothetical protein EXR75_02275 [Myxococcales bacterium]|nr:hypothetical protein [Myxococcales bacterium]